MNDRGESARGEGRPGGRTPRAAKLADEPVRPYGIERHRHLFAAWAAGRAASVKGCRFKVEQGLDILESCGFDEDFATPERLPAPTKTDVCHRAWRRLVVSQAARHNLTFTHGVAAKLINCYLKSRLVCGGYHADARVKSLHPPIDDVMLRTLVRLDIGGYQKEWQRRIPWRTSGRHLGLLFDTWLGTTKCCNPHPAPTRAKPFRIQVFEVPVSCP